MAKLLSIITINYNNADGLKKTMDSVKNQLWQEFEHIVIDGNSTDNSVEVIKSYTYEYLDWISEPDKGIYNAMNKGIERAKGKYLLFLNSGDYLKNDKTLASIKEYLLGDISVLSGHVIFIESGGKRLREHPTKMTFSYLVGNAISHPSTFIKRDIFSKYGLYDERFLIVSDWAYFLKILGVYNESYLQVPLTVSVFDASGISSNKDNLKIIYEERERVLTEYFPRIFNNETDTYIFKKFISTNRRFKYLKFIDNYPLFRKIVTLNLGTIVWLIKLFSKNAK